MNEGQVKTLGEVDAFVRTMSLLIERVEPKHRIDESEIRRALLLVCQWTYENYYRSLVQRRSYWRGPGTTEEQHRRYDQTVKELRLAHRRLRTRIHQTFRPW